MTALVYGDLSRTGRLGNQLWEIASTIGLAVASDMDPRFPKWDYQRFFSLPDEFFVDEPVGVPATSKAQHLDERARAYLQDYGLFADVVGDVREFFKPSVEAARILDVAWDEFGDLKDPISVHVRRGDNVTHPQGYHPLRSMEYYAAGLALAGDGDVIIFSDDPEWCREHFEAETGRKVAHYYEGVARPREYADRVAYETAPVLDWIDLQLMARCERHVISNSTYAWWGAFLSPDPAPMYPSNWFGWRVSPWTDSSLMFPGSWIEIHDPTQGGI